MIVHVLHHYRYIFLIVLFHPLIPKFSIRFGLKEELSYSKFWGNDNYTCLRSSRSKKVVGWKFGCNYNALILLKIFIYIIISTIEVSYQPSILLQFLCGQCNIWCVSLQWFPTARFHLVYRHGPKCFPRYVLVLWSAGCICFCWRTAWFNGPLLSKLER